MRRLAALVLAVLALTGCGIGRERTRTNIDGVDCVIWKGGNAGGLSCDWEHATPMTEKP